MPTISGIVVATGGQGTGRRAFSEIIDELSRPVDAADTTVRALAADAFRAAVRTMDRKGLWPWEILDEDVALTANNAFSTVTGAIKKPLAMHYLNAAGGTRDQPVHYIPYDRFMETFSMDVTAQAHTYTVPNLFETGQIRWFPIPSGDDNARFTYYRATPAPRAESETVEIPDYIIEVYMAFAWYEFLKRFPSERRPYPIAVAMDEARRAFKEISAHVNSPGDRSRQMNVSGGVYG